MLYKTSHSIHWTFLTPIQSLDLSVNQSKNDLIEIYLRFNYVFIRYALMRTRGIGEKINRTFSISRRQSLAPAMSLESLHVPSVSALPPSSPSSSRRLSRMVSSFLSPMGLPNRNSNRYMNSMNSMTSLNVILSTFWYSYHLLHECIDWFFQTPVDFALIIDISSQPFHRKTLISRVTQTSVFRQHLRPERRSVRQIKQIHQICKFEPYFRKYFCIILFTLFIFYDKKCKSFYFSNEYSVFNHLL